MSERVELAALYPELPGEDGINWTGRLLSHAREHGTNRQCSIGYHGECSDRSGKTCRCLCHDDAARWFTVEGHVEGGVFTVTRAEQGKHHWPPVKGEPATVWAHWIMGTSEEDAKARAVNKQAAVLGLEPVKAEHMAAVPGMEPVSSAEPGRPGLTLTRDQLESWAGRALTDEEVQWLAGNISLSSIPEAIENMVSGWD